MKSDRILSKMLETDLANDAPSTNVEEKVIEEVKNLETRLSNSIEKKFAELSGKIEAQQERPAQTGAISDQQVEASKENTETLTGGDNNE
jgi:hypothetical protein